MTERGTKEGGYFHGMFYDTGFLSEEQNIGVRIVQCIVYSVNNICPSWPLTRQKRISSK